MAKIIKFPGAPKTAEPTFEPSKEAKAKYRAQELEIEKRRKAFLDSVSKPRTVTVQKTTHTITVPLPRLKPKSGGVS